MHGSDAVLKSEIATIKVSLKTAIMGQLHHFLSVQRGVAFPLTTSNIKLFLNSTTSNVIVTKFSFKRRNVNFWDATLTLVKE